MMNEAAPADALRPGDTLGQLVGHRLGSGAWGSGGPAALAAHPLATAP